MAMKKKPKERDWELCCGFELRKVNDYWRIFEGGMEIELCDSLEAARIGARELRKSRNEQA